MKLIFNLKDGQKNELLLNLIFPDYPDRNGGADENSAKEKETENSVSLSGCSYTPVLVPVIGVEPIRVISPPDFESGASANSTTPAKCNSVYNIIRRFVKRFECMPHKL